MLKVKVNDRLEQRGLRQINGSPVPDCISPTIQQWGPISSLAISSVSPHVLQCSPWIRILKVPELDVDSMGCTSRPGQGSFRARERPPGGNMAMPVPSDPRFELAASTGDFAFCPSCVNIRKSTGAVFQSPTGCFKCSVPSTQFPPVTPLIRSLCAALAQEYPPRPSHASAGCSPGKLPELLLRAHEWASQDVALGPALISPELAVFQDRKTIKQTPDRVLVKAMHFIANPASGRANMKPVSIAKP